MYKKHLFFILALYATVLPVCAVDAGGTDRDRFLREVSESLIALGLVGLAGYILTKPEPKVPVVITKPTTPPVTLSSHEKWAQQLSAKTEELFNARKRDMLEDYLASTLKNQGYYVLLSDRKKEIEKHFSDVEGFVRSTVTDADVREDIARKVRQLRDEFKGEYAQVQAQGFIDIKLVREYGAGAVKNKYYINKLLYIIKKALNE